MRAMLLPPEDTALFYRAWGALLSWVNDQRNIGPRFAPPTPSQPLEVSLADQIRKVVWAEDTLRERFLAEGAAALTAEERDLIASWSHRVSGRFVVSRHLQKHSIFMSEHVYGVLGLYTPLEVMLPFVPMYVEAVLIPFRQVIITDGLITSPGTQITFGAGARRLFNAQYSAARATFQIRTTLPWPEDRAPLASSKRQSPQNAGRRRRQRG